MAYNEFLADRITQYFTEQRVVFYTKKMFGGLCFMVDDKMCVGIHKDEVMARIHPDEYEVALQKKGCKEMNFTGRAMKGFVFLTDEATDLDEDLQQWLALALAYNPIAKASKKKKTPK